MADLHAQVEAAISALPKPVTEADAIAAAQAVLGEGTERAAQFTRWFERNGAIFLGRVNGQG